MSYHFIKPVVIICLQGNNSAKMRISTKKFAKKFSFSFCLLFLSVQEAISEETIIKPNVTINFRQDLADVDYFNTSFAAISNSYAAFDLICSAPYPVEWVLHYDKDDDGTSEQQKEAMSQRYVSNFSDLNTYSYVANISLRYNGKIFVFTSFSCKSTKDPNLQTNVILTPKERKNVIFMNITQDPIIKIQDNEGPAITNGSCKSYASVSDMDKLSSCWKCEKPDGTDLQLDFIGCNNPIECGSIYKRHNMGKRCLKIVPNAVDDKTYFCRKIGAIDYNPKTLVCKNYGPTLTQLYFFGIPKIPNTAPKMYFDWSEVNPQDMIYIHELPKKLYFGEDLTITCEMSRYYFSYGSWFGLEFSGKNISFYQTGDRIEDESKGTFISNYVLNLTSSSPIMVYCFAPIFNTSGWINASLSLNVIVGKPPKVLSIVADSSSKDFAVGQTNRSLTCTFDGEPKPNITWKATIGYFETLENEDNYSKIQIYPEYPGSYTCYAKSFLGMDSMTFNVTTSELSSKMIKTIISISGFFALALVLGVGFLVFRLCRVIRYQREALRLLTEAEIKEFVEGNPGFVGKNAYFDSNLVIDALPYDKRYEVAPQNLVIDKQNLLGSGAFGRVYKGRIKRRSIISNAPKSSSSSESDNTTSGKPNEGDIQEQQYRKDEVVAVKTCGSDVDVMYFKALLSEVKIMAFLGHHKNVVSLVGACTQNIRNREVYIAVEFCPKGSLESFLKRHRFSFQNKVQYGTIVVNSGSSSNARTEQGGYVPIVYKNVQLTDVPDIQLSTKDLFKWTNDIVCGLEFLHEKKVIHADLAVRNILLSEDLIAKIGDFGLARQLVECSNYVKKTQAPLPWRHLAPESLRNLEFSLKSDIWSLGVTIWEIFTLSEVPYSGTSFNVEFILQLEHGLRLTKPINATNDLYEFMLKCWTFNLDDRPGDVEELKVLCTKSLMLFVEYETINDNEYLQLQETETPTEDTGGYLVPSTSTFLNNVDHTYVNK